MTNITLSKEPHDLVQGKEIVRLAPASVKSTAGRHHKVATGTARATPKAPAIFAGSRRARQVHKLPADLRKVLISDKAALAKWKEITPLARNEWICWIKDAKKPEIRRIRLEKMRSKMAKGKRRPCCWAGCPHR